MHNSIDHTADVIDVRDIMTRLEELEATRDEYNEWHSDPSAWDKIEDGQPQELLFLVGILEELAGYGGDEKWRGNWYPVALIRETYFSDYAIELLNDAGDLEHIPAWVEIDWEGTVENVRGDYSPIVIDGVTYWYR